MEQEQTTDPKANADPAPVDRVVMPRLGDVVKFVGENWKVVRIDSRDDGGFRLNLAIHDDYGKAINAATGIRGEWLD